MLPSAHDQLSVCERLTTLLTKWSSEQDGEELPHRGVTIIFIIDPTVRVFLAELIDLHM